MEFENVWKEFKDPLENFIKSNVDSPMVVDDILQEVSIKLLGNINRKATIRNYQTWLFQVARNTIADYFRKKKKGTLLSYPTVENTLSKNCVCDLSGFLIQNYLPEKYSKPLYLNVIEGKTQKEIAVILALSLTATKSRIQRGKVKLKEVISRTFGKRC